MLVKVSFSQFWMSQKKYNGLKGTTLFKQTRLNDQEKNKLIQEGKTLALSAVTKPIEMHNAFK